MEQDNISQMKDAIQAVQLSLKQAEASRNVQQMYEAHRQLTLAQQRLQYVQANTDEEKSDAAQQFQWAQQQLDELQQLILPERIQ